MGIQPVSAIIPTAQQPIVPVQAFTSSSALNNQAQSSALLIDSLVDVNTLENNAGMDNNIAPINVTNILPAPPTPPSNSQNRTISEKVPSIESPGSTASTPNNNIEWAIKGPVKLKYTQLFNTTGNSCNIFSFY